MAPHLTPPRSPVARDWMQALLIAGAGTMTAAWLAIPLAMLGPALGAAVLPPGPLIELLVVGAALIAWGLLATPLGERRARLLFIAAALVATLLVVWALDVRSWPPAGPHQLAALLHREAPATGVTTLVLWWIGGRIGTGNLTGRDMVGVFGVGLAGLFGSLILGGIAGALQPLAASSETATAIFFVSALCTLPLAQLLRVQERGRAAGARGAALDPRWTVMAGGAALAVLALALLLSIPVSGALLAAVADALGHLYDIVIAVLTPLFLAAGYAVAALLWLGQRLRGHARATPPQPPSPPPAARQMPGQHQGHLPAPVATALTVLVVVAILLVVVIILWRAVRRAGSSRHAQAFEEERASVWSWDEARLGWRALLGALGARARRAVPVAAGQSRTPRTIRDAYRRLLRRGAALGHPRAAAETPQEYLGQLRHVPIADERDAALLTAAYMHVRYGDAAERPEDLAQAVEAWQRLDRALAEVSRDADARPTGPRGSG